MVITGMTINGEEVLVIPAVVVAPAVVVLPAAPRAVRVSSTSLTLSAVYQEMQQQKRQIEGLLDETEFQRARLDFLEARLAASAAKKQRL